MRMLDDGEVADVGHTDLQCAAEVLSGGAVRLEGHSLLQGDIAARHWVTRDNCRQRRNLSLADEKSVSSSNKVTSKVTVVLLCLVQQLFSSGLLWSTATVSVQGCGYICVRDVNGSGSSQRSGRGASRCERERTGGASRNLRELRQREGPRVMQRGGGGIAGGIGGHGREGVRAVWQRAVDL